ncbi:Metal cation efflux system protein CzcD [Aquicella siphonis]|uniref:Metal cation efflux system protein CzcD n=1 Tax=Aquicella siphonis TaxID=254247 RepID=A0A5E4PGZ3_9COXI|nr:cation diffusion facilitator family transporter [Aquicella siphonis]VVC75626.1 Metal cation efflux system protein CzcD [Aquicella siphonis]
MNDSHHHTAHASSEYRLVYALILSSVFLVAEIAGGILTHSLALISDAAHMLTDVTALAIALVAIRLGKRPADRVRTFGYYRFEILAAAFNTILLFLVALYIVYEAYSRLSNPPEIQSLGMLVIALIGLLVNLAAMWILTASKDKSLNMKSAYLEVWSDALGSIGVIAGAIIIRFTGWSWVDSLVAVLIGIWVLPRTWVLLKESINVLLEGVPAHINLETLEAAARGVDGVKDIHELHVWTITSGRVSLTAHVVIDKSRDCEQVLQKIRELFASQFGISHTTLQHESKKCLDGEEICNLGIHS